MLQEHEEEVPEKEDEEKEEEDEETLREGKSPKHGTRPKLQGVKVYK